MSVIQLLFSESGQDTVTTEIKIKFAHEENESSGFKTLGWRRFHQNMF
jgi:hypothetical protein